MKYEFTKNTQVVNGETLTQIRALRDIGDRVKAGDLGGWVENPRTLSQEGNCWIDTGVKLGSCAHIRVDAYITGDLSLLGFAHIGDNAYIDADGVTDSDILISDNVRIASDNPNERVQLGSMFINARNNATIKHTINFEGWLSIFGNVIIDCPLVFNDHTDLSLAGDETILIPPTVFKEFWPITITPKYITIGCQHHTPEEWWAFDDTTIYKMNRIQALEWWKAKKEDLRKKYDDYILSLESNSN